MSQTPDAYAPPKADPLPPQPAPALSPEVRRGARIAGVLLILNAILVLIERAVMKSPAGQPAAFSTPLPAIIDLVIGGSLVAGRMNLRIWAIVRCVAGGVIFTALQLAHQDFIAAGAQVAVCTALLLLLIGNPGTGRIAAGASLFGLYGLVAVLGLFVVATGSNPFGSQLATLSGDVEAAPAREVTGQLLGWHLTMPNDRWHVRKDANAKKDNPLADRWLTRPDKDAHVLVIAETVPNVNVDALTTVVQENGRKAATTFRVLGSGPMPGRPEARYLHTRGTIEGHDIEFYYGVFADSTGAYQVATFAEPGNFAELQTEFETIVKSFQSPRQVK